MKKSDFDLGYVYTIILSMYQNSEIALRNYQELIAYRQNLFFNHCSYALNKFLIPYIYSLKINTGVGYDSYTTYSDRAAIILENRIDEYWLFSILNTWLMCPADTKIIAVIDDNQLDEANALLHNSALSSKVIIVLSDKFGFKDRINLTSYNQVLKTEFFWKNINSKSTLVFQKDSLLIKPVPKFYFSLPFLGAPWSDKRIMHEYFPKYNSVKEPIGIERLDYSTWDESAGLIDRPYPHFHGNGGLSIRNNTLMQQIAKGHSHATSDSESEDIFFSKHIANYTEAPPHEIASSFASETSYNQSSIGFHASFKCLSCSEQSHFYDRHIRSLISLCEIK